MLARIVEEYADLPRFARKAMWRIWHDLIIHQDGRKGAADVTLMNYGYARAAGQRSLDLDLAPEDEAQRYCINLYHQTANRIDLEGKDVIEVGSGRGGGASYIARYLCPRRYVGVDLSRNAAEFCNSHHCDVENLEFVVGEAEDIPFPDRSFDALVNVESSRAYPSIPGFLAEAYRVIRPGGALLLSDMRWARDVDLFRRQIRAAGFEVQLEEDISQNVLRALELDNPRRRNMIRKRLPRPLVRSFEEFAGVEGSGRYRSFADASMRYWSFYATRP